MGAQQEHASKVLQALEWECMHLPDASEDLKSVDPSKAYIIGGLVDRNQHKKLCLDKAAGQGIATARLPLGSHLKMAGSPHPYCQPGEQCGAGASAWEGCAKSCGSWQMLGTPICTPCMLQGCTKISSPDVT